MVSPPSNPIQAMGSLLDSHASSSGLSASGGVGQVGQRAKLSFRNKGRFGGVRRPKLLILLGNQSPVQTAARDRLRAGLRRGCRRRPRQPGGAAPARAASGQLGNRRPRSRRHRARRPRPPHRALTPASDWRCPPRAPQTPLNRRFPAPLPLWQQSRRPAAMLLFCLLYPVVLGSAARHYGVTVRCHTNRAEDDRRGPWARFVYSFATTG